MESFLICENPQCHMILDLRKSGGVLLRWATTISACPECGSRWSRKCPFCSESLEVAWQAGLPHCSSCHERLRARVVDVQKRRKNGGAGVSAAQDYFVTP